MSHPLELIHPRNIKHLTHYLRLLIRERLWAKILVGMAAGLVVGMLFGPQFELLPRETATTLGNWLALPGKFFITIIQMIVIPLVFASVIRGIAATESMQQLKKTGMRLVVYFLLTSITAVSVGLLTAYIIEPGSFVENPPKEESVSVTEVRDELGSGEGEAAFDLRTLPQSLISILPKNPISEAVNMEMLPIVLFSIIFGLALVSLNPKQSKPLLDLLGSLQSVAMAVVKWAMLIAPIAVFGLMAQLAIDTGFESLFGIGVYVLTVFAGLFVLLALYILVALFFGGIAPWRFLAAIREVQLLAFSTGSSVAVLPLTIKTAEEKFKVRPSISQFVLPIGATVNMDATAMFQGVATLFLMQVYGLDLGLGMIILLVATVVGSSIGTPATPGVGIIVLSVVLRGVGVPIEGIALIIGVDRILEMCRTAINVTGDMAASIVMNRLVKRKKTYEQEVAEQKDIEAVQESTGEDTITGEYNAPDESDSMVSRAWAKIKSIFEHGESEEEEEMDKNCDGILSCETVSSKKPKDNQSGRNTKKKSPDSPQKKDDAKKPEAKKAETQKRSIRKTAGKKRKKV